MPSIRYDFSVQNSKVCERYCNSFTIVANVREGAMTLDLTRVPSPPTIAVWIIVDYCGSPCVNNDKLPGRVFYENVVGYSIRLNAKIFTGLIPYFRK